jgi:hypothetical protein
MLTKTLRVAESLFLSAPQIQGLLGDQWPELKETLDRLALSLASGPNPDFNIPLIAALTRIFKSPAEAIAQRILDESGFDYRFITGKPRQFRALMPGKSPPEEIQRLWKQVDVVARNYQGSLRD